MTIIPPELLQLRTMPDNDLPPSSDPISVAEPAPAPAAAAAATPSAVSSEAEAAPVAVAPSALAREAVVSAAEAAGAIASVGEALVKASLNARLAPFLASNPVASIEERRSEKAVRYLVKNPWGDPSLIFNVSPEDDALIDALNNLYLPERYTAIWHKDTKKLEIIWTANQLADAAQEVVGREFSFRFRGTEYKCKFGSSSERLLVLARHSQPVAVSATSFRNLSSFNTYAHARQKGADMLPPSIGEPLSFWISEIEWNEDDVLSLVTNLNFYLTYYDAVSPTILIHYPHTESTEPQTRYRHGAFPKQFAAREIDDGLLHFWAACRAGDPARRFLYCFRIIEYAATSYLEAGVRSSVRRILGTPNALEQLNAVTERVLAAVHQSKLDDYQRLEALLRETVDPELLWTELNRNLASFTTTAYFDGGFSINPILAIGGTKGEFLLNGVATVANAIRRIRNALSHGRDQKTAGVIMPTRRNFQLLEPWASVIAVAAGEVILYEDVL